jgi:hypothetical protein
LDEAEELLHLSKYDIGGLRNVLLDQTDRLTVILTATRKLLDLFEYDSEYTSPFLLGFVQEDLSLLNRKEGIQLIRQTLDPFGPIEAEEKTIEDILLYCGGHPYLIQRMCYQLFDREKAGLRPISQQDLLPESLLNNLFQIDFGNLYPSAFRTAPKAPNG